MYNSNEIMPLKMMCGEEPEMVSDDVPSNIILTCDRCCKKCTILIHGRIDENIIPEMVCVIPSGKAEWTIMR